MPHKIKKIIALVIMLILAVLISSLDANADVLFLKSGKVLEGEIVEEKESAYIVKIEGGIVTFNKAQVESVIYGKPSEEQEKEIEKKQKTKGRVKHEGNWITQDEYDALATFENRKHREETEEQMEVRQEKQNIESVEEKETIKGESDFIYSEYYKKALKNYHQLSVSPSLSLCEETEKQAQFVLGDSLPAKDKELMGKIIKECRELRYGLGETTKTIEQYFLLWKSGSPQNHNEMHAMLSEALISKEGMEKDKFKKLLEYVSLKWDSLKVLNAEIKSKYENEISVSYTVYVYKSYSGENQPRREEKFVTENIEVIDENGNWKINSLICVGKKNN